MLIINTAPIRGQVKLGGKQSQCEMVALANGEAACQTGIITA